MNGLQDTVPTSRSTRAAVRGAAGFSLIELMVVMVLVIGLFGLVGTSISRSVGGAELRNEVREGLMVAPGGHAQKLNIKGAD